jgi:hypothetical protein
MLVILMNKTFRLLKQGLKYSFYCSTALAVSGYAYLQYVNSVLGPISIDKQNALDFYKDYHKMDEAEAVRTYYWILAHISLARIMSFRAYQQNCKSLNAKIVQPLLDNYQKKGILEDILASTKGVKDNKATFNKIVDIRKINTENIELREYIIKEIRTLQKELHTNKLLAIPEDNTSKVDRIHQYICESGRTFRDP